MATLVPAIRCGTVLVAMAGTRPAMTNESRRSGHRRNFVVAINMEGRNTRTQDSDGISVNLCASAVEYTFVFDAAMTPHPDQQSKAVDTDSPAQRALRLCGETFSAKGSCGTNDQSFARTLIHPNNCCEPTHTPH
jgi:hypothetical protein